MLDRRPVQDKGRILLDWTIVLTVIRRHLARPVLARLQLVAHHRCIVGEAIFTFLVKLIALLG